MGFVVYINGTNNEEPGGARSSWEEPGGARRSQEEPGGARRSQNEQKRARSKLYFGSEPF